MFFSLWESTRRRSFHFLNKILIIIFARLPHTAKICRCSTNAVSHAYYTLLFSWLVTLSVSLPSPSYKSVSYCSLLDPMTCVFLYKTGGFAAAAAAATTNIRGLCETAASTSFRAILNKQIGDIRDAGTYKNERVITSPQATSICVEGSKGKILNFCANNYLGLSVSGELYDTQRNYIIFGIFFFFGHS